MHRTEGIDEHGNSHTSLVPVDVPKFHEPLILSVELSLLTSRNDQSFAASGEDTQELLVYRKVWIQTEKIVTDCRYALAGHVPCS